MSTFGDKIILTTVSDASNEDGRQDVFYVVVRACSGGRGHWRYPHRIWHTGR